MNVDTNDVDKLLDEIDILEKDKAKYKKLWEELGSYHIDTLDKAEDMLDFMTDYCLEQKRLHRFNHNHCLKHTVDHLDDKHAARMSNAFTARLVKRLNDWEEDNVAVGPLDRIDVVSIEELIK